MKGFTIKRIAEEAGVSAALVVYHFGGVEGVLEAVYDSVMFELPDAKDFKPADLGQAVDNLLVIVGRYFDPQYYSRSSLLIWLPLFETMLLDETFRQKLYARDEEYIGDFAVHIGHVIKFRQLDLDPRTVSRNLMSYMDGLWLRWCHSDRKDTRAEQRATLEYLQWQLGSLNATRQTSEFPDVPRPDAEA